MEKQGLPVWDWDRGQAPVPGLISRELYKIAQGSTRYNISKAEVMNMRITLPSIEEQNAIATVLVYADKEIELANEKLASLQSQKRGLMQQLLTGKKRIIIVESYEKRRKQSRIS